MVRTQDTVASSSSVKVTSTNCECQLILRSGAGGGVQRSAAALRWILPADAHGGI